MQIDGNQELHPTPSYDVNFDSKEFGNHMVKGEVEKWSEKTDFHKDTYEIKKIERGAENVDNINIVSKPVDSGHPTFISTRQEWHIFCIFDIGIFYRFLSSSH